LNINQLAQLLPNVNPSQLRRASAVVLQGGKLNQQMLGTLGQAFGEVLKADPQTTMKVMRLLKQVEA
jgi:cytochrome c-type biogenesis protein CcmH/NrfF